MKKSLIVILIFVSYVSYGQKYKLPKIKFDNDYGMSMSFLSSNFKLSNWNIDMVLNKPYRIGGFGIEMYSDKVVHDENFFNRMKLTIPVVPRGETPMTIQEVLDKWWNNNKQEGFGVYYVTPSIKKFDLTIGGGSIGYYREETSQVGDYVNGYTKSNGTYVQPYYRNLRIVTDWVEKDRTYYLLFGISKSIKITEGVEFQIKCITRYLRSKETYLEVRKFGNVDTYIPKIDINRTFKPQLMLGIKLKIN